MIFYFFKEIVRDKGEGDIDNKLTLGVKMVREYNGGIKLGGFILGLRVMGN